MGGSGSKANDAGGQPMPSDPVLLRLEQEAVRAAVPRGLQDDKSKQLQHELNWCYTQNNWYFTAVGLVVGSVLGYSSKSIKPLALAAVLTPLGDWLYERHACADIMGAYTEHQQRLMQETRVRADEARAEVRRQWSSHHPASATAPAGPAGARGH